MSPDRGDGLRARLAAWLDISRTVLRLAAPAVDVLVRLSLAKAFFAPGMLPSGLVGDLRTAWPSIIVQVMGPVLLAAGLLIRPVALLMLVLTLLAQSFGAPQDEHLFSAALFGWYVVQGAGPMSLDRVLSKGLADSPVPSRFVLELIGAISGRVRIVGQAARSIGLSASFWVMVCQPSTLRMVI
jgi:NADH dehydrogenase/putative oxidoreductase